MSQFSDYKTGYSLPTMQFSDFNVSIVYKHQTQYLMMNPPSKQNYNTTGHALLLTDTFSFFFFHFQHLCESSILVI